MQIAGVETDEATQEQAPAGEEEETAGAELRQTRRLKSKLMARREILPEPRPKRRRKSKLPVRQKRLPESSRRSTRRRKNKLPARAPIDKAGGETRASSR